MWNCSAVLTRNGSFCNSAVNLTRKDCYLQKCVISTLKKQLFNTHDIAVTKQLNIKKNRDLNRTIDNFFNETCRYININVPARELTVRKFHTCVVSQRAEDITDSILSKFDNARKASSNLSYQNSYQETTTVIDFDPFDHVKEETESQNNSTPSEHHHVRSSKISMRDIEKMYPNAKCKLHNIYQQIRDESKNKIEYKFLSQGNKWQCTLKVMWPEEMKFIATAKNKISSGNVAALKCLHMLESTKKLSKGLPIIYSSDQIEKLKAPVNLSMKQETLNATKILLDKYEDNIQTIIESHDNTLFIDRRTFQEGAIIDPVGKSNPANRYPEKIKSRNDLLQVRYEHRISQDTLYDLPIYQYRDEIVQEIENNSVVVIKGDTGCGKTTQVPQFIMDSFAARGLATDCNIIVAQPRRISAVSLAERVADERQEQVGDVIGYQVRLSQDLPNTPAGVLFCTTGILLRKLQFNPTLDGCSHVIIDEAHERTINTDMLLVLLKRALQKRPNLKVIIMSATINAELFQNYFNCNVIEVPRRTYAVQMNFMEDIDAIKLRLPSSNWDLSFEDQNTGPTVDIVKMGELISWITRNKPPGAILCFLPGWSEITKMKKYLEDYSFLSRSRMMIVPVHSRMSHYDQRKIFSKPQSHVRKIVLATDIAETGITIQDVVYVVDSCTHRQIQWHEKRGFSSIDSHWASKANINQRKGRAGRVQPGESYHFITREKYEELPLYPSPEVTRSSLEKTVLDAKTYSPEKALEFLGAMPQPPSQSVIRHAVNNLINLGALDNEENLTPLGKRIALFTLNPQLSKAIVYSSIFQCVSPMITIASLMSGESEIFSGVLENKSAMRNVKTIYHPTSDHTSLAWLFHQWNSLEKQNRLESREFSYKSNLIPERMFTLSKVREINAEHLYHARMLTNLHGFDDMSAKENEYAELDELCRGVLLSGLDQVLHQQNFDIRKGQIKMGTHIFLMEDGSRATITPESVNFKRKQWPSPFITYARRTHSEERRTSLIRETSIISPLTVFLFSQSRIHGYLHNETPQKKEENTEDNDNDNNNNNNDNDKETRILFKLKDRKNVKLICNKETADVLLSFRDAMWSVVRYMVANYGAVGPNKIQEFDQVDAFRMEMLQLLGKMLSEASETIDNPVPRKSPPKLSSYTEDNDNEKNNEEDY